LQPLVRQNVCLLHRKPFVKRIGGSNYTFVSWRGSVHLQKLTNLYIELYSQSNYNAQHESYSATSASA
jgi:hypothetical protein